MEGQTNWAQERRRSQSWARRASLSRLLGAAPTSNSAASKVESAAPAPEPATQIDMMNADSALMAPPRKASLADMESALARRLSLLPELGDAISELDDAISELDDVQFVDYDKPATQLQRFWRQRASTGARLLPDQVNSLDLVTAPAADRSESSATPASSASGSSIAGPASSPAAPAPAVASAAPSVANPAASSGVSFATQTPTKHVLFAPAAASHSPALPSPRAMSSADSNIQPAPAATVVFSAAPVRSPRSLAATIFEAMEGDDSNRIRYQSFAAYLQASNFSERDASSLWNRIERHDPDSMSRRELEAWIYSKMGIAPPEPTPPSNWWSLAIIIISSLAGADDHPPRNCH